MTVKMGAPMPPMGGMPMNNPMMPRQPMNPLPPPMPVPPIVPPQAAGTFPVNKDKRKRFGDSLETMLARPPMVASDQMAGMNVFTGQMMNTAARPPVVQQMRGGGNVRQMYRDAYSSPSFKSYTDSKKNTYAPNPTNTRKTHEEIMASVRGGSSPNDDRPAPVKMSFSDDDYTPTSAELNEALKDTAAVGMPDLRQDQSDVQMPVFPDLDDRINRRIDDSNAFLSYISKYGTQGTPEDRATILAPGTGGLSSVPSIPSGTSSTLAQNMITFPQSPDTSMQPGPAYSPAGDPSIYVSAVFEAPVDDSSYFGDLGGNQIRDDSSYFGDFGGNQIKDDSSYFGDLGLGDPNATQVGSGRGDPSKIPTSGGQTGTGGGEEQDDRSIVQKFLDDAKAVPGNIMRDIQMGIAAGFYGNYDEARANLEKALNPDGTRKYSDADITSWINRTKDTVENNKRQTQGQSTDDDGPMSTSPVDPCPAGMRLDPVAGICVPVEEGEEEGPSLSLNRTRDDEFNELDDIMKKIVKPIGEDVKTMQAGGSVGLNRVADNFLAAMGA